MRTVTEPHRGRIVDGIGQTLAVWLAVVVVVMLVRDATVAWVSLGVGVLSCLLLGNRHQRRSRADSAVGAYTGVVLWPLLIGVTLVAINIASHSLSTGE